MIRNCLESDLSRIAEIYNRVFNDSSALETILPLFVTQRVRVLTDETQLVVAFYIGTNGNYLHTLAVDEPYQRRGYGRLLLNDWIGSTVPGTKQSLRVRTTNYHAIILYTSVGYRVEYFIKNYYGNGVDAYEMIRA